jgi:hypothetical protein
MFRNLLVFFFLFTLLGCVCFLLPGIFCQRWTAYRFTTGQTQVERTKSPFQPGEDKHSLKAHSELRVNQHKSQLAISEEKYPFPLGEDAAEEVQDETIDSALNGGKILVDVSGQIVRELEATDEMLLRLFDEVARMLFMYVFHSSPFEEYVS